MPPAALMSTSGSTATERAPGSAAGVAVAGAVASTSRDRHQAKPVTAAIRATPATMNGAMDWRARGSLRATPAPSVPASTTMPCGVIS